VRLAARLTGWDIDILTPTEYNKGLDDMEKTLRAIEGVEEVFFSKLLAMGIVNLGDVEEVGVDPLIKVLGVSRELAERMVSVAGEQAKRIAAEAQAAKEAAERAKAEAGEAAGSPAGSELGAEQAAGPDAVSADAADGSGGVPGVVESGPGEEAPSSEAASIDETSRTEAVASPGDEATTNAAGE